MTDFILSAFADEAADTLEGQLAALNEMNFPILSSATLTGAA